MHSQDNIPTVVRVSKVLNAIVTELPEKAAEFNDVSGEHYDLVKRDGAKVKFSAHAVDRAVKINLSGKDAVNLSRKEIVEIYLGKSSCTAKATPAPRDNVEPSTQDHGTKSDQRKENHGRTVMFLLVSAERLAKLSPGYDQTLDVLFSELIRKYSQTDAVKKE